MERKTPLYINESILKKYLRYLRMYSQLIREGYRVSDKIAIALHFPVRLFKGYFDNAPFLWNVMIKNSDGLFACRDSNGSAFLASSLNEWWLRPYFYLKKGGIFLDIGANIGKYSIMVGNHSSADCKIISIEPDPENFKVLKRNIELNYLQEKVLPVNFACSKNEGEMPFYIEDGIGGGSSFYKSEHNLKKISVKTISVDKLIKKFNLSSVDLIKIDVEGAELDVLMGSLVTLKKYHPKIIFECFDDKSLKSIQRILERSGYKVERSFGDNFICQ